MQTQTIGMSFAMGLGLFSFTMLLGWMAANYGLNENLLKWIVLPIFGFGAAFGANSILQLTSCSKFNPVQIATGSGFVLLAILSFLLLSLLSFVRSPIASILPSQKYGKLFAISFYMFWAGMFGEALASGLAQSCG
jgi:hypothetical protein